MSKIFLICLIIASVSSLSLPQEDMRWDAKFALGGGFTPGWVFPNFDEINKMLPQFGVENFSNSGFFTTGGLGHISIAVVRNIRIGMMGFGGSISKEANNVNGINKEAKYSTSILGFTAEYTFPFVSYVAISAGVVIGAGNTTIELSQYNGNFNWNDVWYPLNPYSMEVRAANIQYSKISHTYFTITPTLNIEYPFNRFLAIRVGGGYIFDLGKKWELNNGQSLTNIPSNLNSNALYLQAGIMIGYFNY